MPGRERAGRGKLDYHGRGNPRVARHSRVLEAQPGNGPLTVLIEPLRTPVKETRVIVPRDPEFSGVLAARDELDSLPDAGKYRRRVHPWLVSFTLAHNPLIPAAGTAATAIG
jgi:hypothetical protein